jgi:hypothetical protein
MIDKLTTLSLLAALTSGVIGVISMGSIWVLYFEVPYITYINLPFPHIDPAVYVAGELTRVTIEKCNMSKDRVFYTSSSSMVNDKTNEIVDFPKIPLVSAPGCQANSAIYMRIPATTKPGSYHFYGTTSAPGTYATHQIKWETQPFTVKATQ